MPRTVLILGAGASFPYGFPLGTDLIVQIIHNTKKSRENNYNIFPLLRQKFTEPEIDKFRRHLADVEVNSIDFFLHQNPEYIEIGKACIAYILLECETKSQGFIEKDNSDHWYKYFWNELVSIDPDKFDFKIYTYNYERSLHYYLNWQTGLLFPNNIKREKFLENIHIVHLHGSLGNIDYGNISAIHNYKDLKSVSDSIKIIFEVDTDQNFINLQADIKNSNFMKIT